MNRQTKRALEAKQKMQRNAANMKHKDQIEKLWEDLQRYQQLCFAIVRDQGRVRVPQAAFDGLSETDQLHFKKSDDGTLTITYEPGVPTEPEQTPSEAG